MIVIKFNIDDDYSSLITKDTRNDRGKGAYNLTFESLLEIIENIFFIRFDTPLDVVKAAAEILIFTYLIRKLLNIIKETRAWQLMKGILLIVVVTALSNILEFKTLSWVLNNTFSVMAIGIFMIFQPEMRRGLEQIGRSSIKGFFSTDSETDNTNMMINEVAKACAELAKTKTGALIVIEKETKVGDIINTGINLEAIVTAELLINIFTPNTPLHDGAIIIRGHIIKAATCYLPLTENRDISKELGTRHRAAIGVTEVSDAIAVVVSEETGKISFVLNGEIFRALTPEKLRQMLIKNLIHETTNDRRKAKRISLFKGKKRIGG